MRSNEARPVRSWWFFVVRKVQKSRIQKVSNVSHAKRTSFSCIGALGSGQRLYLGSLWCLAGSVGSWGGLFWIRLGQSYFQALCPDHQDENKVLYKLLSLRLCHASIHAFHSMMGWWSLTYAWAQTGLSFLTLLASGIFSQQCSQRLPLDWGSRVTRREMSSGENPLKTHQIQHWQINSPKYDLPRSSSVNPTVSWKQLTR